MPTDDKWTFSSSGRHMFIHFDVGVYSPQPGFSAKIHYGIEIKNYHYYLVLYFQFSIVIVLQSIVQRWKMEKLDIVHANHVLNMKEIVGFITNVKKVIDVDLIIAHLH